MARSSRVTVATALPPGWKPGDPLPKPVAVERFEPPREKRPDLPRPLRVVATSSAPIERIVAEPDDLGCYSGVGPFLPCRLCEARGERRAPSFVPKIKRWNADSDGFRGLWRAVLNNAFEEATGGAIVLASSPAHAVAVRQQALDWFAHDCDRPFSMVWLAHGLNLSVVHIRKTLREALRQGTVIRDSRGIANDYKPRFGREYSGASQMSVDWPLFGPVRTLAEMTLSEKMAVCRRIAENGTVAALIDQPNFPTVAEEVGEREPWRWNRPTRRKW